MTMTPPGCKRSNRRSRGPFADGWVTNSGVAGYQAAACRERLAERDCRGDQNGCGLCRRALAQLSEFRVVLQRADGFLGPGRTPDAVKVGDLCRLLKVVKIPWENNDHEAFFPRLQHVSFFRKIEGPQEYVEYPPSSDAFLSSLQEAAAAIAALLRTMRRRLQMVFVASPADDVFDAWNRVRNQLNDDRYDVRPDGILNVGYDDKVILRDIENAVLTVHLLGPAYDAFAERQLRLAADAGRRQLIWFSKGTDRPDEVDPKQWKLLESIRRREGSATPSNGSPEPCRR